MEPNAETIARTRKRQYASLAATLIGISALLPLLSWKSSSEILLSLEAANIALALAAGALSFLRHSAKSDTQYHIIGVAFFGTAVLDSFHILVTSRWISPILASDLNALAIWSWVASQLFLSTSILISWLYNLRQSQLGRAGSLQTHHFLIGAIALSVLSGLFFTLVPLPNVYFENALLPRPVELLPATLFCVALFGYLREGNWKQETFAHWLALFLIISSIGQASIIPLSNQLLDPQSIFAHLFKGIGYAFVVTGLILSSSRQPTKLHNAQPSEPTSQELQALVIKEFHKSRPARFGITQKLVLSASLVVLFVAATIGFMAYSSFSNAIEDGEINYLKSKAQQSSDLLRNQLDKLGQDTQFLSKTPPIKGIIRASQSNDYDISESSSKKQWKDRLATIFTHKLEVSPTLLQIRYIGLEDGGREIVRVERAGDEIFRVPESQLQKKSNRPYFKNGIETKEGEIYYSKVELNREWGQISLPYKPTIRGVTPVFDEENQLFGIVVVNLDLSIVFDQLDALNSATSQTYVTNRSGQYLLHPDPKRAFSFEFGNEDSIFTDYPDLPRPSDLGSDIPVKRYSTKDGENRAVGLMQIQLDHSETKPDLMLALSSSMQEVIHNSPINPTTALVTGSIVLGFALVFAWLFAITITHPLRYISWAAETYGTTGKLVPLPTKSHGEVGVLARSLQSLHSQIEERTAELNATLLRQEETNLKLKAAIEEATKATDATDAKSQFLAVMSHEIRTPMNGLIGILDLLENELPEEARDKLAVAQNSAEELLIIINDILDFSKIEAGKLNLEDKDFDLVELLESVTALHAPNAYAKGLALLCSPAVETGIVTKGDSHRLRQVLSNLLNNAIKFTAEGEVEIKSQVVERNNQQKFIEILIRDTGTGIPPDKIDSLFNAFQQVSSATTREFGGTGLGLTISERIVNAMNGEISVQSALGEGSTFCIKLPIAEHTRPSTCSLPIDNATGKHLLIVNNNLAKSKLYFDWLSQWGFSCQTVATEKEIDSVSKKLPRGETFAFALIEANQFNPASSRWKTSPAPDSPLAKTQILITGSSKTPSLKVEPTRKLIKLTEPTSLVELRKKLSPKFVKKKIFSAAPKRSFQSTNLSQRNVLLVDDNATNRFIIRQYLARNHQCKPDEAQDGIEAIELLNRQSYDLVFMDLMMPRMDGFEATKIIRAGETGSKNQNIPIIAITANARDEDKKNCIDVGMTDHLAKPVRQEDVANAISRWLDLNNKPSDPTLLS